MEIQHERGSDLLEPLSQQAKIGQLPKLRRLYLNNYRGLSFLKSSHVQPLKDFILACHSLRRINAGELTTDLEREMNEWLAAERKKGTVQIREGQDYLLIEATYRHGRFGSDDSD